MRNKLVCSCNVKTHASRFSEPWKAFSTSFWLWKCFPCKKLSRYVKKWLLVVRGQVNTADEAKLCSPIRSTFEAMAVWCTVGVVLEKNRALSVGQCWLQVLQFSVRLINLLSVPLRCNGFPRIQNAVADQTSSRALTVTMTLFLVQVWFWEVLWSFFSVQPLSWSSLVVV